jgi:Domain of unknown function (DUF4394)
MVTTCFPLGSLRRLGAVSLLLIVLISLSAAPAFAQDIPSATVFAVTTDNRLIQFSTTNPGSLSADVAISGLQEGESIIDIDLRPATGQLFGLGSSSRLYVINTSTGVASPRNANPFSTLLSGDGFGFDFNPTVDRIRVVGSAGQNLRLNPNSGGVAAVDGVLGFAGPDVNGGAAPRAVASAYTSNFDGAGSTTLYNIDANLDILTSQIPPNAGTLNTIGALGVDAGDLTSFDIMTDRTGTDTAFAAIGSGFYRINLANGQASFIGSIGVSVRGIAVTGSIRPVATVPACADFNGSVSPVVTASIPESMFGTVFCRVLIENRASLVSNAGAQIGVQSVLDQGVIQAVDIFMPDGQSAVLAAPIEVCLLGSGRFIYLDATQSPRVPTLLASRDADGYRCAVVGSTGTAVLVRN